MTPNHPERPPHVLVVFSDPGVGGTSRSALLAGRAWAGEGARVTFVPLRGVSASRRDSFLAVGPLVEKDEVRWEDLDVVHLHHGVVSGGMDRELRPLVEAHAASGRHLPLITHNVFGEPQGVLDRWDGSVTINVLGHWSAYLLRSATWPRRPRGVLQVMPNPQDFDFFRPPSLDERAAARERFHVPGGATVLGRCGSPLEGKWMSDYVEVARRLRQDQILIVMGCPPELATRLSEFPRVQVLDRVGDDAFLRDFYWACDLFVLAAQQGESFGNVILESLACETPVLYLSRPRGDNTPWDFQVIPGFALCDSRSTWVAAAVEAQPRSQQDATQTGGEPWRSWFSVEAVGVSLMAQYRHARNLGRLSPSVWPARPPGRRQWLDIVLTHNAAVHAARTHVRKGRRWLARVVGGRPR